MLKLGDVLQGQVNSYGRTVVCGAVSAVLRFCFEHRGRGPASWGWCAVPRVATYTSGDSCDVQTPFSKAIIMYFGGCGGDTGLRMNDDGQWYSACQDGLHLYTTHIKHTPPSLGRCLTVAILACTSLEEKPWV